MKTIKFIHPVLPELGVEIFTIMVTRYFWSVLIVLKEVYLFIEFQKSLFDTTSSKCSRLCYAMDCRVTSDTGNLSWLVIGQFAQIRALIGC